MSSANAGSVFPNIDSPNMKDGSDVNKRLLTSLLLISLLLQRVVSYRVVGYVN